MPTRYNPHKYINSYLIEANDFSNFVVFKELQVPAQIEHSFQTNLPSAESYNILSVDAAEKTSVEIILPSKVLYNDLPLLRDSVRYTVHNPH